ncbi:hypothetical protein DIPPA_01583 [Diplonema papillatum]|nr:hypothetical protein DIPPA_01583 [Diplonema papillatum]
MVARRLVHQRVVVDAADTWSGTIDGTAELFFEAQGAAADETFVAFHYSGQVKEVSISRVKCEEARISTPANQPAETDFEAVAGYSVQHPTKAMKGQKTGTEANGKEAAAVPLDDPVGLEAMQQWRRLQCEVIVALTPAQRGWGALCVRVAFRSRSSPRVSITPHLLVIAPETSSARVWVPCADSIGDTRCTWDIQLLPSASAEGSITADEALGYSWSEVSLPDRARALSPCNVAVAAWSNAFQSRSIAAEGKIRLVSLPPCPDGLVDLFTRCLRAVEAALGAPLSRPVTVLFAPDHSEAWLNGAQLLVLPEAWLREDTLFTPVLFRLMCNAFARQMFGVEVVAKTLDDAWLVVGLAGAVAWMCTMEWSGVNNAVGWLLDEAEAVRARLLDPPGAVVLSRAGTGGLLLPGESAYESSLAARKATLVALQLCAASVKIKRAARHDASPWIPGIRRLATAAVKVGLLDTDGFLAFLSAHGDVDLLGFKQFWVYGHTIPRISVCAEYDASAECLTLTAMQEADAGRPQPPEFLEEIAVCVALRGGGGVGGDDDDDVPAVRGARLNRVLAELDIRLTRLRCGEVITERVARPERPLDLSAFEMDDLLEGPAPSGPARSIAELLAVPPDRDPVQYVSADCHQALLLAAVAVHQEPWKSVVQLHSELSVPGRVSAVRQLAGARRSRAVQRLFQREASDRTQHHSVRSAIIEALAGFDPNPVPLILAARPSNTENGGVPVDRGSPAAEVDGLLFEYACLRSLARQRAGCDPFLSALRGVLADDGGPGEAAAPGGVRKGWHWNALVCGLAGRIASSASGGAAEVLTAVASDCRRTGEERAAAVSALTAARRFLDDAAVEMWARSGPAALASAAVLHALWKQAGELESAGECYTPTAIPDLLLSCRAVPYPEGVPVRILARLAPAEAVGRALWHRKAEQREFCKLLHFFYAPAWCCCRRSPRGADLRSIAVTRAPTAADVASQVSQVSIARSADLAKALGFAPAGAVQRGRAADAAGGGGGLCAFDALELRAKGKLGVVTLPVSASQASEVQSLLRLTHVLRDFTPLVEVLCVGDEKPRSSSALAAVSSGALRGGVGLIVVELTREVSGWVRPMLMDPVMHRTVALPPVRVAQANGFVFGYFDPKFIALPDLALPHLSAAASRAVVPGGLYWRHDADHRKHALIVNHAADTTLLPCTSIGRTIAGSASAVTHAAVLCLRRCRLLTFKLSPENSPLPLSIPFELFGTSLGSLLFGSFPPHRAVPVAAVLHAGVLVVDLPFVKADAVLSAAAEQGAERDSISCKDVFLWAGPEGQPVRLAAQTSQADSAAVPVHSIPALQNGRAALVGRVSVGIDLRSLPEFLSISRRLLLCCVSGMQTNSYVEVCLELPANAAADMLMKYVPLHAQCDVQPSCVALPPLFKVEPLVPLTLKVCRVRVALPKPTT